MADNISDIIAKRLAKKYNLPLYVMKQIIHPQSSVMANTISKGAFEPIKLSYLGSFEAMKKRIIHLNNNKYRRGGKDKSGDTTD